MNDKCFFVSSCCGGPFKEEHKVTRTDYPEGGCRVSIDLTCKCLVCGGVCYPSTTLPKANGQ